MPLSTNDIESELSYAYLHAVATRGGMNCKCENRNGDNYVIDAIVDYFAPIPETYITDVQLRVQLKATFNKGKETDTHISYTFNGINQYNILRTYKGGSTRILVVLFLSPNQSEWLNISHTEFLLKQSAYWVCLEDASESTNTTSQTIYLPKTNLLTTESLTKLCQDIGKGTIPKYEQPLI